MSKPWWRAWSAVKLSPLNPLAVAAAQLSPPEDWYTLWRQAHCQDQFTQYWWLCWHARPDLREQMMRGTGYPLYDMPSTATVIHPETMAEWRELPRWADVRLRQQEWIARIVMLCCTPLTVEQ